MNFYLSLVMERSFGEAAGLKVYSFSTFFFPKLCGGGGAHVQGHAAVKRWTKAVDLFLYDLIMVPLHLGVHWALAVSQNSGCQIFYTYCMEIPRFKSQLKSQISVLTLFFSTHNLITPFQVIDLKSKTVKSYDSMGQRHDDICGLLL